MKNREKKPRLWEALADTLRREIHEESLPGDISISRIARRHSVSLHTAWKAVRACAGEGLLTCRQGKKIALANQSKAGPAGAEERLYASIRDGIINGAFRAGFPLPKVNYFVVSEKASPNTICSVFSRLEAGGLVYKRGKSWIVGKKTGPFAPSASASNPPTVLLLTSLDLEWNRFYKFAEIVPFSRMLVSELHDHGIMLSLAFMDKPAQSPAGSELPIPSGEEEIAAHVASLGTGYQGTLVYCGMGPPPSTQPCMTALSRFDKPIVYFDHRDEDRDFFEKMAPLCKGRLYYLHFDESAADRLAVQTLVDLGHRCIGLPVPQVSGHAWIARRVEHIRGLAGEYQPSPKIVVVEQNEKFWRYFEEEFDLSRYAEYLSAYFADADRRAGAPGIERRQSLRAALVRNTPSLVELFRTRGLTACIALGDFMAREIYLWCVYTGVEVPGRVSLLSFDNNIETNHFPISTIDFGFPRLGYQAAHIFINDIPIPGRKGDVPGICRLMDRGSLAKAQGTGHAALK